MYQNDANDVAGWFSTTPVASSADDGFDKKKKNGMKMMMFTRGLILIKI